MGRVLTSTDNEYRACCQVSEVTLSMRGRGGGHTFGKQDSLSLYFTQPSNTFCQYIMLMVLYRDIKLARL